MNYEICKEEITNGLINNKSIFKQANKILLIKRLDDLKDVLKKNRVNIRIG